MEIFRAQAILPVIPIPVLLFASDQSDRGSRHEMGEISRTPALARNRKRGKEEKETLWCAGSDQAVKE